MVGGASSGQRVGWCVEEDERPLRGVDERRRWAEKEARAAARAMRRQALTPYADSASLSTTLVSIQVCARVGLAPQPRRASAVPQVRGACRVRSSPVLTPPLLCPRAPTHPHVQVGLVACGTLEISHALSLTAPFMAELWFHLEGEWLAGEGAPGVRAAHTALRNVPRPPHNALEGRPQPGLLLPHSAPGPLAPLRRQRGTFPPSRADHGARARKYYTTRAPTAAEVLDRSLRRAADELSRQVHLEVAALLAQPPQPPQPPAGGRARAASAGAQEVALRSTAALVEHVAHVCRLAVPFAGARASRALLFVRLFLPMPCGEGSR